MKKRRYYHPFVDVQDYNVDLGTFEYFADIDIFSMSVRDGALLSFARQLFSDSIFYKKYHKY